MAGDNANPTLLGLSFSKVINVSTGSSSGSITASVRDEGSGVERVSLQLGRPLAQWAGFNLQWIGVNAETQSPLNEGVITGGFSVYSFAAPGRYDIVGATVYDNVGNQAYYSASQVASMAGQAYILVTDSLTNPSIDDLIQGTPADELLTGLDGADTLFGFDGSDQLFGNKGDDVLFGNQGSDSLYGGQGIDFAYGGQGDDEVYGNFGDDFLFGNAGNDTLYGGQGSDFIYGGQGDDVIYGDRGNDILLGDRGADLFVFGIDAGQDLIGDFNAADGDRIDLGGRPYQVLTSMWGETQIGYAGGTITLANIVPSQVSASWFI